MAENGNKNNRSMLAGPYREMFREYDSLPAARLLTTTLDQSEIAILEGDFFRTFQVITVPSNGKVYLKVTTPPLSAGRVVGLVQRELTPAIAGIWYRVYSGATGVVTTGTPWAIFNENGNSPKTSAMLFQNVSSVGSVGTLTDIAYQPEGAVGTKVQGSLNRNTGFKILPVQTELLVEYENLNNASNQILVYYQWIEAPTAVTGI